MLRRFILMHTFYNYTDVLDYIQIYFRPLSSNRSEIPSKIICWAWQFVELPKVDDKNSKILFLADFFEFLVQEKFSGRLDRANEVFQ